MLGFSSTPLDARPAVDHVSPVEHAAPAVALRSSWSSSVQQQQQQQAAEVPEPPAALVGRPSSAMCHAHLDGEPLIGCPGVAWHLPFWADEERVRLLDKDVAEYVRATLSPVPS